MNKKMILGGIVVAAIALAPLGVKNMIDKSIDLKKTELSNIGVFLSIEKDEGYINSTRDFKVTIKDENKFKEYFKSSVIKEYPAYEILIDEFMKEETKNFDEFLKGIVFKGNIKNSNLNPSSDIKVYAYLDSLSNEIMNDIKKDKEASEIIMPLFEKEALAFNMVFDSKSKLKTISLKDINEKIKSTNKAGEKAEGNFQLLGYEIINKSTDKEIIADAKLDKIQFDIDSKSDVNIVLNNLKYNINYESQFVNNGKMQIDNINLVADSKVDINLGKTEVDSSGVVTNGVYSAKSNMKTKNFKIKDEQTNISLNDLNLNMYFDDVDYKSLKNLTDAYNTYSFENLKAASLPKEERIVEMQKNVLPLLKELTTFLNNGLSMKIDSNLLGFNNGQLKLDDIKFDLDAKLNKNDLNVQSLNQLVILSLLNVDANLEMMEKDFVNLTGVINPQFAQMMTMYAKREDGKVLFDLDLKKGKIEVNGQKVN